MITQKPISLKVDSQLLEELDKEVRLGWRKRNWHINQAIALYLEVQDLNRRLKCNTGAGLKHDEVERFLRKRIPNGANW